MNPLCNCPNGVTLYHEKLDDQKYWCRRCKIGIILKDGKFRKVKPILLIKLTAYLRYLIFFFYACMIPAILVHLFYIQVFGVTFGLKNVLTLLPGAATGFFIYTKKINSFTRFSDAREMLKTFEYGKLSRWKKQRAKVID